MRDGDRVREGRGIDDGWVVSAKIKDQQGLRERETENLEVCKVGLGDSLRL